MTSSSPSIPPTSDFDLADFEHGETLPSSDHCDDLQAIELVSAETAIRNRKEGKVIQHRAWPVPEAFRSECDSPQETPSRLNYLETISSSPPILSSKMPVSSPIAYSPSSSPLQKKRHHAPKATSPLKEQAATKLNRPRMGGFMVDDSSDDDEEPARKKRALSKEPARSGENGRIGTPDDYERVDAVAPDEVEDGLEALNAAESQDVVLREKPKSIFAKFKKPAPKAAVTEGEDEPLQEKPESIFANFKDPALKPVVTGREKTDSDGLAAKKPTSIFSKSKTTPGHVQSPQIQDPDTSFTPLLEDTDTFSTEYPIISSLLHSRASTGTEIRTCSGKSYSVQQRKKTDPVAFERMVAARSTTRAGRATKSYYGIDIHQLMEESKAEDAWKAEMTKEAQKAPQIPLPSVEETSAKPKKTMMWTEKYRAKKFTDLVGDDRTHRHVLKWLKAWDHIVFPRAGASKPKPVAKKFGADAPQEEAERAHRKILLLTGPPGLGKTTLAHVCARQAGYEVMEINASDERSSNVVKGRIRDSVGTESVKTVTGSAGKSARPVCVVVDEVDGVVSGSGGSGGEGGFIKALVDLIALDQKNSSLAGVSSASSNKKRKDKDRFRLMRPIILICNDLYHPALRPIRQASFAEIVHIRPPPLDAVISRMSSVFAREGIEADVEGVRRLCEATWGMGAGAKQSGREASGTGEGDLRGILVVGESVARQLKSSSSKARLSRKWVEQNMISKLSADGSGARGIGRGGTKEIVQRIFMEGGGFPKPSYGVLSAKELKSYKYNEQPKSKLGVAEIGLKASMERLREMIETSGEVERVLTDVFASYPKQNFQDDTFLSKPNKAYEWLSFHDSCSSRIYSNQEWELLPYLSQPVLACHTLFASTSRHQNWNDASNSKFSNQTSELEPTTPIPFTGPMADRDAREAEKANRALLTTLQASLSRDLSRSFRSPESIATELVPYVVRMLTPDVKPIIVGGSGGCMTIASVRKESERAMVRRAVDVMNELGVVFEKGKLEDDTTTGPGAKYAPTQWVYRMEPPLDILSTYETTEDALSSGAVGVRYGVRQVLDQEYQKSIVIRENAARQARFNSGSSNPTTRDSRPGSSNGPVSNAMAAVDSAAAAKISKVTTTGRLKAHVMLEESRAVVQKRDFFGRLVVKESVADSSGGGGAKGGHFRNGSSGSLSRGKGGSKGKDENKVWVSFHEGFSNAVRRPVRVEDILDGLV